MPLYHFHVSDGLNYPDREGTELPDLMCARVEAIKLFGTILAEESIRMKLGEQWCMEVKEESGLLLFRLDFVMAESPAAIGALTS